jgi:DNA-binding Lrp family transcriptional regulator/fido (protein-threonine AMPylation protein)
MGLSDANFQDLMAKAKQDQQFKAIQKALAAYLQGAALEQMAVVAQALGISRNTLIRRLAQMVDAGLITKTGVARGARYHARADQAEPAVAPDAITVPLSTQATDIRNLVRRPTAARQPVGYERAFLESYRPNETSYLSPADKDRLAALGGKPAANQAAGTQAQAIFNRLLIDLSWNSSRLEGNTYSLLDTQRLIEFGETVDGKGATEAQMILNHKAAIEFLVQSAGEITFDRATVLNLHALLAENLLADPGAAGRLRTIPVGIGGSVFHPTAIPQLISECFDSILAKASAILDPFEQAFFVMVQLPYLQPFDDVNKRTSRLAANIPLIHRNLAPLSFVDVPKDLYTEAMLGVYELNRIELMRDVFLWAYERSARRYAVVRQTLGEPDPFRLRHRQSLKTVIAAVITEPMGKQLAGRHVATWAAAHIAEPERARFIEVAETELLHIHEGNFARYQVRPSEFAAWQKVWTSRTAVAAPSPTPRPKPTSKRKS